MTEAIGGVGGRRCEQEARCLRHMRPFIYEEQIFLTPRSDLVQSAEVHVPHHRSDTTETKTNIKNCIKIVKQLLLRFSVVSLIFRTSEHVVLMIWTSDQN